MILVADSSGGAQRIDAQRRFVQQPGIVELPLMLPTGDGKALAGEAALTLARRPPNSNTNTTPVEVPQQQRPAHVC